MKRIMIADEDDGKPKEAPDPSGSNANGDRVGRDGNGAGRRKTVTPKQREANRRSAQKSTGPKTPEGKERVRLNALKHGILSQEILLPDEDGDALAELARQLQEDLQPVGAREELLVDLITRQFWKLRRSGRAEAAVLAGQLYAIRVERAELETKRFERTIGDIADELDRSITNKEKHQEALAKVEQAKALRDGELATFGWAFERAVAGPDAFSKLSRYETAILRSLDKAFEQLRLLRQARLGNAGPTAHMRTRRRALGAKARTRDRRR